MNRNIPLLLLTVFLTGLMGSCSGRKAAKSKKQSVAQQGMISVAERFEINKTDSCTIVTIKNPWQGAKEISQTYFLVKRGSEDKFKDAAGTVIPVPVRKIICMSSTHLAMISALGEQYAVSGVSGAGFIYDSNFTRRILEGRISDVGYEAGLNNELMIRCSPDLIMMYGIGNESAAYYSKIRELGFKVMFDADYLETDPLGKAEWIKVFGLLFCREKKADSLFSAVCMEYNHIKDYIAGKVSERPKVLLGMPFRDTWYVSPGNSYISNLIRDAGGEYLWQGTQSSFSMPYSIESVYLKSADAGYWLNTGSMNSASEIASLDPRLRSIPAFAKGNLYNNTRRMSAEGGNDYWESGTLKPYIILKDIASILHPGLFENYELFYYRKLN